jgi:hypothetical protein
MTQLTEAAPMLTGIMRFINATFVARHSEILPTKNLAAE